MSDDVLDVLGDDTARSVLSATHPEAKTAKEISEETDVSLSTVYRKVERLEDAELVVEQEVVAQSGPKTVYASTIEHVTVEHGDDGLITTVTRDTEGAEDAMADRFADIWNTMRGSESD